MKESAFEYWAEMVLEADWNKISWDEMILEAYRTLYTENCSLGFSEVKEQLNDWLTEFFNP